jgi:hypothetical protein
MVWNIVPYAENLPKEFEEWKKIWNFFPPSFLDCWVSSGNKKCRAYFDAPNRRWVKSTRNEWNSPDVAHVSA